jgi:hypothetical protein
MTNKRKYGKKSLDKNLVRKTWKKVLKDEDALPKNWIWEARVLVGVVRQEQSLGCEYPTTLANECRR